MVRKDVKRSLSGSDKSLETESRGGVEKGSSVVDVPPGSYLDKRATREGSGKLASHAFQDRPNTHPNCVDNEQQEITQHFNYNTEQHSR